ncbi:protein translocase subunit SecD [Candidatus Peregrinibacteria bacterium]|nr:MAG: protein translocase subunit SecD [Candidatus Peregrinibacteria bacterium]
MKSRFSLKMLVALIGFVIMGLIVIPNSLKSAWPDHALLNWMKSPELTLGLDLQGGTQLDYRIDLRNVEEKNADEDPLNDVRVADVVEGVRNTIERRVNGLGVSEPNIYLSNVGDEQHIVVELAGISDVEEAKATVGKTIQLEFKEPNETQENDKRATLEPMAQDALDRALNGEDFKAVGEKVRTSDGSIDFRPEKTEWETGLPSHYQNLLSGMEPGAVYNKVLEGSDGFSFVGQGQLVSKTGLFLVQLVSKEVKERTIEKAITFGEVANGVGAAIESTQNQVKSDFTEAEAEAIWGVAIGEATAPFETEDGQLKVYHVLSQGGGDESITASQILIAYKGAKSASTAVTRTKAEAETEAKRIAKEAQAHPDQFADLAKQYSDGPNGPSGGDLGPFGRGVTDPAFEQVAFAMEPGTVSDVVETDLGFHIIQVRERTEGEPTLNVEKLQVANTPENRAKLDGLLEEMKPHSITRDEAEYVFNEIYFDLSPDPWKKTGLDGSKFKYASVTYNQLGAPVVAIQFDSEGATLFEELTGRLVGKQIAIFVGGELISAPNVDEKISGGNAIISGRFNPAQAVTLANDLNTGAIDAPILLSGQYTISASLGDSALQVSLYAGLVGLIVLALFMLLYYRLLGFFAVIALGIYSIIILFILKLFPIVMTLAGIAGIILSIGMAVDANILIFERTKEELASGKGFSQAIQNGFERAWSSIRDSNVSSLITCAILWFFGNSIIRGFALMLAIGILISMFTAITVTRSLIQTLRGTKLADNKFLMGAKRK